MSRRKRKVWPRALRYIDVYLPGEKKNLKRSFGAWSERRRGSRPKFEGKGQRGRKIYRKEERTRRLLTGHSRYCRRTNKSCCACFLNLSSIYRDQYEPTKIKTNESYFSLYRESLIDSSRRSFNFPTISLLDQRTPFIVYHRLCLTAAPFRRFFSLNISLSFAPAAQAPAESNSIEREKEIGIQCVPVFNSTSHV